MTPEPIENIDSVLLGEGFDSAVGKEALLGVEVEDGGEHADANLGVIPLERPRRVG